MANLRLRFLHGQRRGEELSYSEKRVTIGRSQDNDIVLPGAQSTSSAHHAELSFKDGRWWIADLGSTNGTYVNDVQLVSGERRGLRNKDRLGFGGAPILLVALPGGSSWAPVAGVAALLLLVSVLGYRALHRVEEGFRPATETLSRSVYLIALDDDGDRRAVASAFAVSGNGLLATTAHVAAELEGRGAFSGESSLRVVALLTDSETEPLAVVGAYPHPQHEAGTFENDVALLQVELESPLSSLPLADDAELEQVQRGVRVGIFGFPASSTDVMHPRARFIESTLGDVRGGRYFEIGRGIQPGMSGSPIVTPDGRVVGIVVGGELDRAENQGAGNWGLSVAALKEMLAAR